MNKYEKNTYALKLTVALLHILLAVLLIAMIPLGLYVTSIPISIILVLLCMLLTLLLFIFFKTHGILYKLILSVITVISMLSAFAGIFCNPYWDSIRYRPDVETLSKDYSTVLTYHQAIEDLQEAMWHLKSVHPMLVHGYPETIKKQYAQARKNLKQAETITINDLDREIEQILSLLGDGHTLAYANYPQYHTLKTRWKHEKEKDTLIAINGITLDTFFEQHKNLFSYEIDAYGKSLIYYYLWTAEDLDLFGLNPENGITYTFQTKDGTQIEETAYAKDFVSAIQNVTDNTKNTEQEESFVSYQIDESLSLAILTLKSCQYDDTYIQCLKEMFTEVKKRHIRNVCVDLRDNGGGNSLVADEFIHYLAHDAYQTWGMERRTGPFLLKFDGETLPNDQYTNLIFSGDVYVLTNINTFSSAMDFAMLITDNKFGTIIGEASGNKPEGYGDVASFVLRNSGIYMQVSFKKWYRVDRENTDELIEPDIKCDSTQALEELKEMLQ